ncbi:MAG: hypothetical protein M1820_006102 [Bogoriella megaspora]|nr:MAG: hypothetical protein M1820_006102 [Bogoriella megaspora]
MSEKKIEATSITEVADDEKVLARFGKRQQFGRGFSTISAIGLTCALMLTWDVLIMSLQYGLQNGGPAGLFYGYIVAWIGGVFQALVMAEMASMIPLAGGPFNWVSILAPPWCRKFLSYLAGWITIIVWQTTVSGTGFVCGTIVQGLLILNHPTYVPQRWHGTLMACAMLAVALLINLLLGRQLPRFEIFMLAVYIAGFIGLVVPVTRLSTHKSAAEVFTVFQNLGGWSTQGVSFFVGFLTAMNCFLAFDAPDHIAEEIENAAKVIPIAMLSSLTLNGILGLGMLLVLLFCMGDIVAATQSTTGYPFIDIFTSATGSARGGTALTCVILTINVFSLAGALATASRMLWAFSREKGVPFSKHVSKLHSRTQTPVVAMVITVILNRLVTFIYIGSAVALQAFIGVIVAAYYSSFFLCAGVMLHKRLTTPESTIPWRPFRLGRFGVPVTVIAILYTMIGFFFSFWPYTPVVTPSNMNYTVVLFGGTILFSLFFWAFWGRKVYKGPIVEIQGSVIEIM